MSEAFCGRRKKIRQFLGKLFAPGKAFVSSDAHGQNAEYIE